MLSSCTCTYDPAAVLKRYLQHAFSDKEEENLNTAAQEIFGAYVVCVGEVGGWGLGGAPFRYLGVGRRDGYTLGCDNTHTSTWTVLHCVQQAACRVPSKHLHMLHLHYGSLSAHQPPMPLQPCCASCGGTPPTTQTTPRRPSRPYAMPLTA
jgi:hypothetical protein